jgi:hypothetical protein
MRKGRMHIEILEVGFGILDYCISFQVFVKALGSFEDRPSNPIARGHTLVFSFKNRWQNDLPAPKAAT